MRYIGSFFIGLFIVSYLMSCESGIQGRRIVKQAIEVHGGDLYNHMFLEFDFRGRHYTAKRYHGHFIYTREFRDSDGYVKDILTNDQFVRLISGDTVDLPEAKVNAYSNSVNGVIYFALLPQALNDPAVNLELVGERTIKHKDYHQVKVTFDERGGGKDHDDIFIYWFDKNSYRMDYFAYLFYSEGGGIRFREAVDFKNVNGILFANYKNFAMSDTTFDVCRIDSLFVRGQLKLLSEIELENIEVTLL
jgi:hypothetical protein